MDNSVGLSFEKEILIPSAKGNVAKEKAKKLLNFVQMKLNNYGTLKGNINML